MVEAGEPSDPPILLLQRIAGEIADCCGHHLLKSHRLARGWTVGEAVRRFHGMCAEEGLGRHGLVERSWYGWEAGEQPNDTYRDLLARMFAANVVMLGFAADYAPDDRHRDPSTMALALSPGAAGGSPRETRQGAAPKQLVEAADMSAAARDALEFARRAEATEVGAGLLEHLEGTIECLAASFASTPPAQMFPQVHSYRQLVQRLIGSQQTLRERRDLFRCAGWLSIILGWLSHDLGDPHAAEAHCLDAWQHGWQAESGEICGWSMDTAASVAVYNNQPIKARDAALKGLSQVQERSTVAIRLTCQLARAYGRLGDGERFAATLATTRSWLDALPHQGSGLFAADAGRIESYAATSSIWLGHPSEAVAHAQAALAFYREMGPEDVSPTREAISRLDLSVAFVELEKPDHAVEEAVRALDTGRLTGAVLVRADELNQRLRRRYPSFREGRDLGDRYEALVNAQKPMQLGP